MVPLYSKKKVEIVVEAARQAAIVQMVEAEGATGYTVVPQVHGKGRRGVRDEAHVSDVFRNVMIIVVTDGDTAGRIVAAAQPLLEISAGIVLVSDVQVGRADHF